MCSLNNGLVSKPGYRPKLKGSVLTRGSIAWFMFRRRVAVIRVKRARSAGRRASGSPVPVRAGPAEVRGDSGRSHPRFSHRSRFRCLPPQPIRGHHPFKSTTTKAPQPGPRPELRAVAGGHEVAEAPPISNLLWNPMGRAARWHMDTRRGTREVGSELPAARDCTPLPAGTVS